MTELLFMKDCYIKEFEAKVLKRRENYVVLDRTAFYPLGGGQPGDKGKLSDSLGSSNVINVVKDQGEVRHFLDKMIDGENIHGVLDWSRRYAHMRMHSAQHLLSAIILDKYGAETAGNQIEANSSRIDFNPLNPNEEMLDYLTKRFNDLVDKKIPINIHFTTRDVVLKTLDERRIRLFSRVPESVKTIRVVEIEGVDKVPCAGTHVKNTGEIGHIKITKTENKGKDTVRIRFELG